VSIVWEGLEGASPASDPYFGIKGIFLVEYRPPGRAGGDESQSGAARNG
jgi:hypothetical protein